MLSLEKVSQILVMNFMIKVILIEQIMLYLEIW